MPQTPPDGRIGFEVSSSFIGFFKDGDNIVYNLAILQILYCALESTPPERRVLLTKPIVVQIACVTKAVLVGVAFRSLVHFRENVPNIQTATLLVVRAKVEKSRQKLTFRSLISIFEQSNVFHEDPHHFARLVQLATRRNRVHISNRGRMAPAHEGDLFLEQTRIEAELICEELVKRCALRFTRNKYFTYVKPLRFPWAPDSK